MRKPKINKVKQVKFLNRNTRTRVKHTYTGTIIRLILLVVLLSLFAWTQNNFIILKDLIYTSEIIPKYYNDYKIILLSDIENSTKNIYKKVDREKPNIVLIAGGLTDVNDNFDNSVKTINKIGNKYTTFYVLNNEDMNYKNDIINKLTNAKHIGNTLEILEQNIVDEKEYVNKYMDAKLIEEAQNGNEDAFEILSKVINGLERDVGRGIELVGMDYSEDSSNIRNNIVDTLSNNENNFKILLYGDYGNSGEVTKTNSNIGLTGGAYYRKGEFGEGRDSNIFKDGTTIFITNGIGSKHQKRFINYPNIISIKLSSFKEPPISPLEKLLDIITIKN